jgi:hemolysin activation/secretion protein
VKKTVAIGETKCFRTPERAPWAAFHAAVLILSIAIPGAGHAQQAQRPPTLTPSQTEKNIDTQETERKRATTSPLKLPNVARPEIPTDTGPLFKLAGVTVTGASTLSGDVIAETYRRYIGKSVSKADLATIAVAISDRYRDAGYYLSRAIIPPQDVKGGRIRIRVIEGTITDIVLKGEGTVEFGIRPVLDAIVAERPARLQTLERQLLLVNERPGVRITDTTLEEVGKATGRFRLIVYLKTVRIGEVLGLSNWGTPPVGPLQAYASSAFNSVFTAGDTIGLNLSTAPDTPRELRFGRLSYDVPVGLDGVRLGASALYGDVWPGDFRRNTDDHTTTNTYEARAGFEPILSRKSALRLTGIAGFTDSSERSTLGTIYNDHIRTVGVAADYKLHDDLGGWNYLSVLYRQGIGAFGASHSGDGFLSNSGASGIFSLIDYAFTRYQSLSNVASVKFSTAGQWASAPLLTSQQFYLGGPIFGRGYYSGDLSDDNGVAGSAELRLDQKLTNDFLKGYQLYGFVDGGAVWNHGAGRGDVLSLSSAGAGVRFYLAHEFLADFMVATPMRFTAPTDINHGVLFLFSVSRSFDFCPTRQRVSCS